MSGPVAQTVPPWLTERQLSEVTGIPLATLRTRRCREPERSPPYRRLGRRVVYKWVEVDAWLTRETQVESNARGRDASP